MMSTALPFTEVADEHIAQACKRSASAPQNPTLTNAS